MSLSLMNVGQMKRIVNASQNFDLLISKHEDVVNEDFQGDASNLKLDFIDVGNNFDNMF